MKNLSAKSKLTIWNSFLMILMVSIVMVLILSFSDDIIKENSQTVLMNVVTENADELEFEDDMLEIDDVDFFKNSVYTLLYTQDGRRMAGNLPDEFNVKLQLNDNKIGNLIIDKTSYYTYDQLVMVEDYPEPIWVRGLIAIDEVAGATNSILQMAFFTLPIFILLATIGSYFITKHTFKPIEQIIETAEEISKSENLSLRINLENSVPEIQKLSHSFDRMFERLESSFEAEKQFSQNVSHELRTPTAVILAQCEYSLGNNVSEDDKEQALKVIQKQAKKTSKVISDLLNLIRLERGLEKNEFTKIDFSELLNLICEEQMNFTAKNINLTYNIQPNINIIANQGLMIRLVTNLLSNAFRYGRENGIVKLELTENNQGIILKIEDNGIGIAKEKQEKIWQRFYQVDSSRTADKSESMGLGLAMVKQIAKIHQAEIQLSSELGKGSCFVVKFL